MPLIDRILLSVLPHRAGRDGRAILTQQRQKKERMMKTDTQPAGSALLEPMSDHSNASTFDGPVDPETIAHSDANILRWTEYLPEECIRRMIQLKWDVTT
jgi:hypothetical protein